MKDTRIGNYAALTLSARVIPPSRSEKGRKDGKETACKNMNLYVYVSARLNKRRMRRWDGGVEREGERKDQDHLISHVRTLGMQI